MARKSKAGYPGNWKEIAGEVKALADWKCVRCGHPHEPGAGYALTVHHLDMDPSNNAWWNIPPLCQRCHLQIQAKVIIEQPYMFEHSDWFKPYVAGYCAHQLGLPDDRDYIKTHAEEILEWTMTQAIPGKPLQA